MLESIYIERLEEIHAGTAQSCTVSEWRNKLKGHKESCELKSKMEQRAINFLSYTSPAE